MNNCSNCKNKICLKSGKPCEAVEKLLPKPSSGRLRGEHSFDPSVIDKTNFEDKTTGKRKKAKIYNENWEI